MKTEKVGEGVEPWSVITHTDAEYKLELNVYASGMAMDDGISSDAIRELLDARTALLSALTEKEELKLKLEARFNQFADALGRAQLAENRITNAEVRVEELKKRVEKAESSRKHTQDWYASHYGRLQDWARKVLPEPYRNQFFSCIANGTYDAYLDVGEPYMCKAGFMVTPSGYMHMDDAKGQLVIDQTRRAENAENELSSLRTSVVSEEWIDCKDGLPPMNPHSRCVDWDFSDRVEVVSEGVVCIGDMATNIHNGETNWISESGERLTGVTYWKNLPAIPKPIEREG